jgi:Uma2 family endonuclease
VVDTPKNLWTEADVQALPEDGCVHEIVDGELVMSPKNDFFHGDISTRLSAALLIFVRAGRLGTVLDSSTGFWMNNRNCRAPDISFISRERLVALGFRRSTRRFFPGAPDLAVEILSANPVRGEIDARLKDFFSSGTRLAWIIDPDSERVEVCRSLSERRVVGRGGYLEGEDLLPNFRLPISELFREWDWEQSV